MKRSNLFVIALAMILGAGCGKGFKSAQTGSGDQRGPAATAKGPRLAAIAAATLKYPRPQMVNPTIIDLNKAGGQDWWGFGPDQDVIFYGASTTRTSWRLQTEGGRNIMVIGGHYVPSGGAAATLSFMGVHGSVHVEGVHIDNKNSVGTDGIAVAGASGKAPDVTVQNYLCENMSGELENWGRHGDCFQTQGPVNKIRLFNITGTTSYQAFFIPPQQPTGSAELERINARYTDPNNTSRFSYLYWFLDGTNQKAFPVTLKDVYAVPRNGQAAEEYAVWPKASLSGIGAVRSGNQISWPNLPYTGFVTVGAPSTGDFVKASDVGVNYNSGTTQPAPTQPAPTQPAPLPPTPAPTPVPTVPSQPAPSQPATPSDPNVQRDRWYGKYYDNADFTNLKTTRYDAYVYFEWRRGSPTWRIDDDTFSVAWEGLFNLNGGLNRFEMSMAADDAMRVYVDGVKIYEKATSTASTEGVEKDFGAGYKLIRVEYVERAGRATAKVRFNLPPTGNSVPLPPSATPTPTPPPSGTPVPPSSTPAPTPAPDSTSGVTRDKWLAKYYASKDFTNLKVARYEAFINNEWNTGSPALEIPADGFSATWEGDFFLEAGTTRFTMTTDDGMRLYVDGVKLADNWKIQAPTVYSVDKAFSSGGYHRIKVEYFEEFQGATAKLQFGLVGSTPPATGTPPPTTDPGLPPPTGTGAKLRWAPPTLSNPQTIQLGTGFENRQLSNTTDYIIKMPNTKKVGGTILQGGRNIVIIGGHTTIPWRQYNGDHTYLRSFFIQNNVGTVHIEGVLIDSSGGMEQDGIAIQAPSSTVQVQNVRMEDLVGTEPTMHSDFIQPWGGVKALRVDRFTGNSNYQGFFLVGDTGPVGRIDMSNVNVRADSNSTGKGGYMLWWGSGYPATLSNFYIQPKPGGSLSKSVWPENGSSQACWSFVQGCAVNGAPAADFVPRGVPGVNYQSPGYQ